MTRFPLQAGRTLVVAGPASVGLLEGTASILGAPLTKDSKVVIRSEKQVPVLAESDCQLELWLGEGAQTAEHPGSTIPRSWQAAAEAIAELGEGVVVVIGGTDAGKSTLSTYLLNSLVAAEVESAFVDADIGQSDLGPPTSIAGAVVSDYVESLTSLAPDRMFFAGDNSPGRIIDRVIAGIGKIIPAMEPSGRFWIVNTDGWVNDELAFNYKLQLLNEIHPTMVIGLQSEPVETILKVSKWPSLVVQPPDVVKLRSRLERKVLREYGYRRHLEGSKVWTYPANPDNARIIVATESSKAGTGLSPSLQLDLRNLILGLVDARGFALGIGILMDYDRRQHSMKIHSPQYDGIVGIEVGNIRLGLDGTEIGYLNESL